MARRARDLALNLMSSPGSGKTTLLERTIGDLGAEVAMSVIEGDQETLLDADRIRATGCRVVQVNTGAGCHLDADMLARAPARSTPRGGSVVLIENVGNLVCPALFDLGEAARVVVMSVTEGEDKPIKYPHMFRTADLMVLNKVDLLPYVDFDVDACIAASASSTRPRHPGGLGHPGRRAGRLVRVARQSTGGGDGGLADADAAVVGRDCACTSTSRPAADERRLDDLGEPGVLEHAAGEGDGVEAALAAPARPRAGAAPRPSASWKPAASTRRRRPRRRGRARPRPRAAVGSSTASPSVALDVDAYAGAVGARHRPGQRLQLDGGLGLVGDPWPPPSSAATASNSRPTLVVTGPCAGLDEVEPPRAGRRSSSAHPRRPPPRAHADGHPPRLADGGDAAGHRRRRAGGRPARTRSRSATSTRRPRGCRRSRSRGRRRRGRATGSVRPCSTRHAATWAWWCCTRDEREVEVGGQLGATGTRGAGRGPRPRASTPYRPQGGRWPGRNDR